MVKIAKGNMTNVVPQASFENFFKNNGWEVVDEKSATPSKIENKKQIEEVKEEKQEEVVQAPESTDEEWDEAIEEEFEKPISEMSKAELREKAKSFDIDVTGLTSNQLRDAIREAQA